MTPHKWSVTLRLIGLPACAFAASLSLLPAAPRPGIDVVWRPVTDAERALKAPLVDKNAGVEAIFWDVHVMDDFEGDSLQRVFYHYVRLKVFNQEGKDAVTAIDIPYGDKTGIVNVAGRTMKPNGEIVELSKDAIHDRVMVRAGGLKQKAKSFAMPGVEIGSIVEYRWREIHDEFRGQYLRVEFSREFPVERVTYYLKPLSAQYTSYRMSSIPFNCTPSPLKIENDGFNSTFVQNVPAFHEEPMMPGEGSVRPWMLVFYHDDNARREPDKYWQSVGKKAYTELKQAMKTNGDLKRIAAKAVDGAKDDDERVARLIGALRGSVRNFYDRGVTDAERAEVIRKSPKDRIRNAGEIYKSGIGTADEMNTLFAALALECGLDARPAMISSRNDLVFDENLTEEYFLRNIDMAVLIGGEWKIYDLSANLLPIGMLSWPEEGARALLADPKKPFFISAPYSPPEASISQRVGKLALSPDGALEGTVHEILTGHSAYERRVDFEGNAATRQADQVKEAILAIYPTAEVNDIKVENVNDPEKPLRVEYHIKIPGYGQRTGKRIFFQPFFFERGKAPMFTESKRLYDIFFHYAWEELDNVRIALPPGFELENSEKPGPLDFGKAGSYSVHMTVEDKTTLSCSRQFTFGNEHRLLYARDSYNQMKDVFDDIQRRDSHTMALKQIAETPKPAAVTGN